jgi:hypothetical protein
MKAISNEYIQYFITQLECHIIIVIAGTYRQWSYDLRLGCISKEGRQPIINPQLQRKESRFLFWHVQFIVHNKIIIISMRFWRHNAQWPCEYWLVAGQVWQDVQMFNLRLVQLFTDQIRTTKTCFPYIGHSGILWCCIYHWYYMASSRMCFYISGLLKDSIICSASTASNRIRL